MLARVVHEEVLEVVARRGEYDLVTLEAASVTGESDVGEGLGVEEPLEHGEHVGLVLGPPQAELVGQRVQPRDGELRQQAEIHQNLERIVFLRVIDVYNNLTSMNANPKVGRLKCTLAVGSCC